MERTKLINYMADFKKSAKSENKAPQKGKKRRKNHENQSKPQRIQSN